MAAADFLSSYTSGSLPCLTPYNRKYNVLSASLNKTCSFFLYHVPVLRHIALLVWVVWGDVRVCFVIVLCVLFV